MDASNVQVNNQMDVQVDKQRRAGRLKLLLIVAICTLPVIASYFTYYVLKPTGRTNYGDLIDPRNAPMPDLHATTLDGKAESLDAYKGKWLLVQVDDSACQANCQAKLFEMRQQRLMQGKEMDRIERVWLVTGDQTPNAQVLREFDGMHVLHVDANIVKSWLPVDEGSAVDHIYVIDPVGNLMFRFPKNPDHAKMKKDIYKLLTASSIG